MRQNTVIPFPGTRIAKRNRAPCQPAMSDKGVVTLSAYGQRKLPFTISDVFGRSVLWVRDSYVYERANQPSLCFRFHGAESPEHTARILSCEDLALELETATRMYLTQIQVCAGSVRRILPLWLCDSDFVGTPLVLTSECRKRFLES